MGNLQIQMLGTSLSIQADEDSAYLEALLSYYRKVADQVQSSSAARDPLKIAILSGIMLCDELYKEKQKSSRAQSGAVNKTELTEAERITLKMIASIDEALK